MEFEVIKDEKKEMTFALKGEDHTFCRLLLNALLEDKAVEFAKYHIDHPLAGKPVFYVRVKSGTPRGALKDAAKEIKKKIKGLK